MSQLSVKKNNSIFFFFVYLFLASGGGSPLYPEILQYYTMIQQRIRIIVVDAGFEIQFIFKINIL